MIIIDESAAGKLIQALRDIEDTEGKCCIHISPGISNADSPYQRIISQAQKHLSECKLYLCEEGDVFLLTRHVSHQECRKAMLEIAHALNVQPADTIGTLYDLDASTGVLLRMLEKREEEKRLAREARLRQEEQAIAENKRQSILQTHFSGTTLNLNGRRQRRVEPEFMIIEDDPFSTRLVENVLQKQYRLTACDSSQRALSQYATIAPDILFLDINLPDVTGLELLERIMALDPQAYVIMLSGNADKANIMQAMRLGAKGFIAKPFSRDKIFQYIERCPTIKKERVS